MAERIWACLWFSARRFWVSAKMYAGWYVILGNCVRNHLPAKENHILQLQDINNGLCPQVAADGFACWHWQSINSPNYRRWISWSLRWYCGTLSSRRYRAIEIARPTVRTIELCLVGNQDHTSDVGPTNPSLRTAPSHRYVTWTKWHL